MNSLPAVRSRPDAGSAPSSNKYAPTAGITQGKARAGFPARASKARALCSACVARIEAVQFGGFNQGVGDGGGFTPSTTDVQKS